MTFALMAPLLMGVLGASVDYWRMNEARMELQNIADAAAITGAHEFTIAAAGQRKLPQKVAEEEAAQRLETLKLAVSATPSASVEQQTRSVTVDITAAFKPSLLLSFFNDAINFTVTATASSYFASNLCVLTIDTRKQARLSMSDNSRLSGVNCAIHVNSSHADALLMQDSALLEAVSVLIVGGADIQGGEINPAALTDTPSRLDPLRRRRGPGVGNCSETDWVLESGAQRLSPGTYCGGLRIRGDADVEFSPGTYVIKHGPLVVEEKARVTGADVGFFLTGSASLFEFRDEANVEIAGPESGPMAGLLIFQDRNTGGETDSLITSSNVDELVGTIYLPKGDLFIDTSSEVAEASAFTAIISDELHLRSNSHLVLNSDYEATGVPLPDGLDGPPVVSLRN